MNFVVTNSKYFAALFSEIINLQGAKILSEITSNTRETRDAPGGNRIYILPLQNRRQRYEKLILY